MEPGRDGHCFGRGLFDEGPDDTDGGGLRILNEMLSELDGMLRTDMGRQIVLTMLGVAEVALE
jgi:hypothetical protein